MLVGNSELKMKDFKKWIREKVLNDASMSTHNHYKQEKYMQHTYQVYILKKIHKMKNMSLSYYFVLNLFLLLIHYKNKLYGKIIKKVHTINSNLQTPFT